MKMWAIILALAIGMALLPGFRDKAEITGKVVVTAVGVDVAEGKADSSGVRVSVQAVETMKTAGSLTEQEKNATEVYAVEGRSIAGSMQAFATQTGRGAYILHNKVAPTPRPTPCPNSTVPRRARWWTSISKSCCPA